MTVREQLIEILRKPIFPHELADPTEAVADYLLDNGVTVQRWIPVTERLPDEAPNSEGGSSSELVLVVVEDSLGSRFVADDITVHGGEWVNFQFPEWEVTHWMPLPQAPRKEGA